MDHKIYDRRHGVSTQKYKTLDSRFFEIPEGKMGYYDANNGMRLIAEYKDSSFVTTIGCLVPPAGAIFERPEERGSALFLEHVLLQVRRIYLSSIIIIDVYEKKSEYVMFSE